MINRLATMALLAVAAVATTACAGAPAATKTPSAAPTATIAVPTATPAVPNATPAIAITTAKVANAICMEALMTGKLARDARTGLGVTAANGQQMPVEWPFGYSARNDGGRLALVDETGVIVAREGDTVEVGGGFGNVMWHACGPVTVGQGN
jgi:hypothetical protein